MFDTEKLEEISNEDLAQALAKVPAVKKWVKAIEALVNARAIDKGETLPGYKVVEGKAGARSWEDPDQVEKLLKSFRIKQTDMYKTELITPAQAEALTKGGVIKEKQFEKLQELIFEKAKGLAVVPESDKRPAYVVPNPLDDLPNLDESPNGIDDLIG